MCIRDRFGDGAGDRERLGGAVWESIPAGEPAGKPLCAGQGKGGCLRVAGRPLGDPVSRTEGGLEGDCREAATGRRGPTAPDGRTLRRHSTDTQPPMETALRRDAGTKSGEAPDPGFGNCSGGSLRYALNARPTASQGFASGATRTVGRVPAKGDT